MSAALNSMPPPLPGHSPGFGPGYRGEPMLPHPAPAQRSRAIYVWAPLAMVAAGYLGLAATRPDLIAGAGIGSNQDTRAEMAEIKSSVGRLESELAGVKSDLATTRTETRVFGEKLATLSDQSSKVAAAAPPTAAPGEPLPPAELRLQPVPVGAPINTAASNAARGVPGAEVPSGFKIISAPEPSKTATTSPEMKVITAPPPAEPKLKTAKPIETGSVNPTEAQPVIDPAAPPSAAAQPLAAIAAVPPKAPAKPVGIQIATGPSLDALRLSWTLLSETHAQDLKNLEPRYSTGVNADGLTYNLMAGPVKTAAEAKKMCKQLAAKAIPCKVMGEFSGEGL